MNKSPLTTRKKFKSLNAPTMIILLATVAAVLTYLIPAGIYDMVKDPVTGRSVVDAASFHFIDKTPIGLLDFLSSFPRGLIGAANLIFPFIFVGGCFQVFIDTGCLDAGFNALTKKTKGNNVIIFMAVLVLMALLGIFNVAHTIVYVVLPISIVMAKKLKLDPMCAAMMAFLIGHLGFGVSPVGAYTVVVAQEVAELPLLSGAAGRWIVTGLSMAVALFICYRYAAKISHDPSKMVVSWEDSGVEVDENTDVSDFNWKHKLSLVLLGGSFILFTVGVMEWKWDLVMLAAVMIPPTLICSILFKMDSNLLLKVFLKGCNGAFTGGLVMGLARAITIILTGSNVIHTMIYFMALPLAQVSAVVSAVGMGIINFLFNFLVPSGSGQAVIVMPIMSPLADIVGVSRQVAVQAYQFGDGICNFITPTSGALMTTLAYCGIPYSKWLKWVLPFAFAMIIIGLSFIGVAQSMGWA